MSFTSEQVASHRDLITDDMTAAGVSEPNAHAYGFGAMTSLLDSLGYAHANTCTDSACATCATVARLLGVAHAVKEYRTAVASR